MVKKIFGQKNIFVQKKIWSIKFCQKKIFGHKIFGKKKFFGQKNIFGPKNIFLVKKMAKKCLVKKMFGQKNFCSKKILPKNFFGGNIYLVKIFLV